MRASGRWRGRERVLLSLFLHSRLLTTRSTHHAPSHSLVEIYVPHAILSSRAAVRVRVVIERHAHANALRLVNLTQLSRQVTSRRVKVGRPRIFRRAAVDTPFFWRKIVRRDIAPRRSHALDRGRERLVRSRDQRGGGEGQLRDGVPRDGLLAGAARGPRRLRLLRDALHPLVRA